MKKCEPLLRHKEVAFLRKTSMVKGF